MQQPANEGMVGSGGGAVPVGPFPPPPGRIVRADFPHTALLHASHQGLSDLSVWQCFLRS